MKETKEDIRYLCPKCHKEYKHYGWYRRHCLNKHSGVLPAIIKKVVDKYTINSLFTKMDALESKIDMLALSGTIQVHDIDIKSNLPKFTPKISIPLDSPMGECVRELKSIFKQGLDVLGKMEDHEVGIKTEDEINEILRQKEVVS